MKSLIIVLTLISACVTCFANDTTPPEVSAISIVPSNIDLTSGGKAPAMVYQELAKWW